MLGLSAHPREFHGAFRAPATRFAGRLQTGPLSIPG